MLTYLYAYKDKVIHDLDTQVHYDKNGLFFVKLPRLSLIPPPTHHVFNFILHFKKPST